MTRSFLTSAISYVNCQPLVNKLLGTTTKEVIDEDPQGNFNKLKQIFADGNLDMQDHIILKRLIAVSELNFQVFGEKYEKIR